MPMYMVLRNALSKLYKYDEAENGIRSRLHALGYTILSHREKTFNF